MGVGVRTSTFYDGFTPICELDDTGAVTAVNTFGAQGLLSRHVISTSASTFYTFDERGNFAQRTDGTGAVLSADLYDAYGKLLSGGAGSDPWGFEAQSGYYTDSETGLILCTHRYYDPSTGRFVTRDPMGYAGGIDLYGYTADDPVNGIDPSGFDPYAQGQKFLVHGQKGNYIIDVPFGQNINRNVQEARTYFNSEGGLGDGSDIDLKNLWPFPGGRTYDYINGNCPTNTRGDYKDKPQYIDPNIDPNLNHERRLAGNFNYGAMAHVFGAPLFLLLVSGDADRMINTRSFQRHPADEQQAIVDGYLWYERHYGK